MDKKKPIKLSNIAISHISLVKSGANQKEIIYKSADGNLLDQKTIEIKKTDNEKGIVYGIVYAPNEIDTDGEYADADEIIKASYEFMKNGFAKNIDKEHSLNLEDAYMCESWIVKSGDPVFPDEPEGAWAVGIKLESEELKKAAKKGDIAGISMFGKANKQSVEPKVSKAESMNFDKFVAAMKEAFSYISFNIHGGYDQTIDGQKTTSKSKKEGEEDLRLEDIAAAVEKAVKPLADQVQTLQGQVEDLQKSDKATQEALKKSKQKDGVPETEEVEKSKDGREGVL